jgi:DEAD/DEAH box helicase domain-containing protein
MRHIILDVETIKSFDEVGGYFPEKLGVSFVGIIERTSLPTMKGEKVSEQRYELFEKDLRDLAKILERAEVIVGFNVEGFDLPAIKPYYGGDIRKLPVLDLMQRFKQSTGHRISLDSIATETLGTSKSGNGLDAISYYKKGELEKLAKYCMKDVEITRDIYDFGRLEGKIKYKNKWNELVDAKIDFNFEPAAQMGLQMSLV